MQIALALEAARRIAGQNAPIRSVQGTFLAPVMQTEPAVASAVVLRAGRSVTQVQADLHQGGSVCFQCTAILGAARESQMNFNSDMPSDADPEHSLRLDFIQGVTPNMTQHYDLRWVRGQPPFTGASDPMATIFVRPRADHTRYNESEFFAITDVIPPPVISIMRSPSPVSSMNCGLELIRPEVVYGMRQWIRFEVTLTPATLGRPHASAARAVLFSRSRTNRSLYSGRAAISARRFV